MQLKLGIIALATLFIACQQPAKENGPTRPPIPLIGTWELISATSTERDSTVSTFNPRQKMIKIINPTHFAFFSHDSSVPRDSTAPFTSGGGAYTLQDSIYTEHLDYFIQPEWEGNKFEFVVTIKNDTLTQKGIEKVEKLGIEHVIVERYKRIK